MRTRVLFPAVVLTVTALAVGCSGGDDASEDPTANLPSVPDSEFVDMTGRSELVVDAKDNQFEPQYVEVSAGTKVTFTNEGRNPHNVIPVDKSQFDAVPTDEFQPGDSATITVGDPGVYPYYCSLHGTPSAGMDGRIRVVPG